jgi:GNAT superfamily N-acetyltransferase
MLTQGLGSGIEIVPATIGRWDLIAALFGTSTGVSACWCMWPLRRPKTHQPAHDRNKAEMNRRLVAGETLGLLAIADGRAFGWCAVGPRRRYPQYETDNSGTNIWAIPCIYIEPSADRKLVARALIQAAISEARRNAAATVQGPPPWWLPGDGAAIAQATAAFVENGFRETGPGARMPELWLPLASDR